MVVLELLVNLLHSNMIQIVSRGKSKIIIKCIWPLVCCFFYNITTSGQNYLEEYNYLKKKKIIDSFKVNEFIKKASEKDLIDISIKISHDYSIFSYQMGDLENAIEYAIIETGPF